MFTEVFQVGTRICTTQDVFASNDMGTLVAEKGTFGTVQLVRDEPGIDSIRMTVVFDNEKVDTWVLPGEIEVVAL